LTSCTSLTLEKSTREPSSEKNNATLKTDSISCKKTKSAIFKPKNTHKAFEITLTADQEQLQETFESEDVPTRPALLSFEAKSGRKNLPVLVRQRGNSRRELCQFKPLKLSFLSRQIYDLIHKAEPLTYTVNTNSTLFKKLKSLHFDSKRPDGGYSFNTTKPRDKPFKGLGKSMDIVSHCGDSDWNLIGGKTKEKQEQKMLQEYYFYKIQNILYPVSLQVQLLNIKYQNSNSETVDEALGFFREKADQTAKRCGFRKVIKDKEVVEEFYDAATGITHIDHRTENSDKTLENDLDSAYQAQFLMLLFHNYDFSYMNPDSKNKYYIVKNSAGEIQHKFTNDHYVHNMKMVISKDSKQHLIPYDFDLSTLITQKPRFNYGDSASESVKKEFKDWWDRIDTTQKRVAHFQKWILGAQLEDYHWYSRAEPDPKNHFRRGVRNINNFLSKKKKIKKLIENSRLSKKNREKFLDWLSKSSKGLSQTLGELERQI